MKFAVIYARYSGYLQTEQSIEGQVRECTEYAKRNGIVIVQEYIDRAMSGTNDKRVAFQSMIKDSAKKEWDTVLVYKLDRFSRDKYEMAIHRKALRSNGARLVSVTEPIPDTPEGILLESMLEGMAEYYSMELSQKTKRGKREGRIKGNAIGGQPPFGYSVESTNNGKKYVVNELEAAIVRRMFEEYAKGKVAREIAEDLTEDGIYNRDGNPFKLRNIAKCLSSECYIGIYRHKEDGIFTNIYPPIVPRWLFDICQESARLNLGPKGKGHGFLLRGRLKCGYCGKSMIGMTRIRADGSESTFYKCRALHDAHPESGHQFPVVKGEVEQLAVDTIRRFIDTEENRKLLAKKILEVDHERCQCNPTLDYLYAEREACQATLRNITNAITRGTVTKTTKQRLSELESRLAAFNERIAREKEKETVPLTMDEVLQFIDEVIQQETGLLIRFLTRKILCFEDRLEIYFNTKAGRPDGDHPHQVFCVYRETVVRNGEIVNIDVCLGV